VNKNYSYLYCIKVIQITQWKIRCTDETGATQYIENKIYRRLSSTPSLSANKMDVPALKAGHFCLERTVELARSIEPQLCWGFCLEQTEFKKNQQNKRP
jgi:hypothetical protein